jgi:predicted nucleic acid-binding protein
LILVDTNVLIDVAAGQEQWSAWSLAQLAAAKQAGELVINSIIYAEFSMGFDSHAECQREITRFGMTILELPTKALFRAGQAFIGYRKQGGSRTGVLPDFFIGAHADVLGVPLLTRDEGRYRTYFPDVKLITP